MAQVSRFRLASRRHREALSLIEILVVVAIILVLAGLLVPVIGMVRESARSATTANLVATLDAAMRTYADEDPRHFFPVPAPDLRLIYDPAQPTATLTVMEGFGYAIPIQQVDGPGKKGTNALLDGWSRPLRYQLDGQRLGTVDPTATDRVADRPAPVADWNPRGLEPFAYVWSIGRPKADDASDALPANAAAWIYQRALP